MPRRGSCNRQLDARKKIPCKARAPPDRLPAPGREARQLVYRAARPGRTGSRRNRRSESQLLHHTDVSRGVIGPGPAIRVGEELDRLPDDALERVASVGNLASRCDIVEPCQYRMIRGVATEAHPCD